MILTNLEQYYKNVYSQQGEDGIIEFIISKLNINKGYFVEFGAWDGIHFSNTCNLWKNKDWGGLLIELDQIRFNQLVENLKNYPKVNCSNNAVEPSNINELFDQFNVPCDLDLLSIDIDGNDYYTWQALNQKYQPKIVIIEPCWGKNKTENPEDGDGPDGKRISSQGTNILPFITLGKEKGYELLEHTGGNLIFLRKDLFDNLGFKNPEDIRTRFRRYCFAPGTDYHNFDWLSN